MNATETMINQIADIQQAIELLSAKVDEATSKTQPDKTSWKDVSRLAMAAEAAREFIERAGL